MSRERTRAINGIFVAFVLAAHCYTNSFFKGLLAPADNGFILLRDYVRQLCVVPFLFYSGYGIFLSIRAKGRPYLRSLVLRRFPMLLAHFASAVLLFILLRLALGRTYPLPHLLLSLAGWENVGNSCWFIFVTLALYLCTALSFFLLGRRPPAALLLLAALAAAGLGCLFDAAGKTSAWSNTLAAFPESPREPVAKPLQIAPRPSGRVEWGSDPAPPSERKSGAPAARRSARKQRHTFEHRDRCGHWRQRSSSFRMPQTHTSPFRNCDTSLFPFCKRAARRCSSFQAQPTA